MNNDQVKKILLAGNYASEEDIKRIESGLAKDEDLSGALINEGIITTSILGQATAEFYHVPYADLSAYPPLRDSILKIPEETARKYRIVTFTDEPHKVTVATDNPSQPDLPKVLAAIFKDSDIYLVYALPESVDLMFLAYQKPLETRFSKIIKESSRVAPEIIDEIVSDAITLHASDVHFEPVLEEVVIRFRIDGVLHEAGRIKKNFYESILNRIKVQGKLRIDEHYATQDGSIRYQRENNRGVDLRVSIVPTVDGEKVVIRVLGEYVRGFKLSDLGFSPADEKLFRDSASKPFGMILVTGPTGAGKTTTLYALIRMLNQPKINITTIEDPVEYHLVGINQIQVNPATDLTFSKGLRSIIRQDPDIVLVGEIRDSETAEIAVNAALTGHLMLSTFHANDAATAIPRLLNMGVEPFLIASTLELIVAQRLVRKICLNCRRSVSYSIAELSQKFRSAKMFFDEKTVTLYEGKGCDVCNHTGFTGRTAIYELIKVTPELQNVILKNPASTEVWQMAREQGSRSLFEDGIEKVKSGVTTIVELLRVSEPPEDLDMPVPKPPMKKK